MKRVREGERERGRKMKFEMDLWLALRQKL
jgi:hypothetical protein